MVYVQIYFLFVNQCAFIHDYYSHKSLKMICFVTAVRFIAWRFTESHLPFSDPRPALVLNTRSFWAWVHVNTGCFLECLFICCGPHQLFEQRELSVSLSAPSGAPIYWVYSASSRRSLLSAVQRVCESLLSVKHVASLSEYISFEWPSVDKLVVSSRKGSYAIYQALKGSC